MATYHAARKRWPEAAMNSRRILTGRSAPELLEPIRRKFGVPERVLDVLVAEVGL